jgi:hypothetical protein
MILSVDSVVAIIGLSCTELLIEHQFMGLFLLLWLLIALILLKVALAIGILRHV